MDFSWLALEKKALNVLFLKGIYSSCWDKCKCFFLSPRSTMPSSKGIYSAFSPFHHGLELVLFLSDKLYINPVLRWTFYLSLVINSGFSFYDYLNVCLSIVGLRSERMNDEKCPSLSHISKCNWHECSGSMWELMVFVGAKSEQCHPFASIQHVRPNIKTVQHHCTLYIYCPKNPRWLWVTVSLLLSHVKVRSGGFPRLEDPNVADE